MEMFACFSFFHRRENRFPLNTWPIQILLVVPFVFVSIHLFLLLVRSLLSSYAGYIFFSCELCSSFLSSHRHPLNDEGLMT